MFNFFFSCCPCSLSFVLCVCTILKSGIVSFSAGYSLLCRISGASLFGIANMTDASHWIWIEQSRIYDRSCKTGKNIKIYSCIRIYSDSKSKVLGWNIFPRRNYVILVFFSLIVFYLNKNKKSVSSGSKWQVILVQILIINDL